jgi:hypothetical protein
MAKGDRKSPSEAALLGILIVGLGHVYLGMWGKGIALFLITIVVILFTTVYIAPVFWIISCVWAYYDAKSYNREWGYSDGDVDEEATDEDVEEATDSYEILKELRAIRSTVTNWFAAVAILLIIILSVMVYLLLHFTRLVLAP